MDMHTPNAGASRPVAYRKRLGGGILAAMLLCSPAFAGAVKTVIAQFGREPGTGSEPVGPLVADQSGALYGATTLTSGTGLGGPGGESAGYGTVFKLTPPAPGETVWRRQVLHVFDGSFDGYGPSGLVIMNGKVYGVTRSNTVFELSPPPSGRGAWSSAVIASFGDTVGPIWIIGSNGALYGDSSGGGPHNWGTVFRLTPPASGGGYWTDDVLSYFTLSAPSPEGPLVIDGAGALFGAVAGTDSGFGGVPVGGFGAVFKLTPPKDGPGLWNRAFLYQFRDPLDGSQPVGPLVQALDGTLYGVTRYGGSATNGGAGFGEAFSLAPPKHGATSWTKTTIHAFAGGADGSAFPSSLSGTAERGFFGTAAGVPVGCQEPCSDPYVGAVFKLRPPGPGEDSWTETILYAFNRDNGGTDGALLQAPGRILYGVGGGGAGNLGAVFELHY